MNKKNYMSPMVEILNARVERGFQSSSSSTTPGFTTTEPVPENTTTGDMGEFD